MKICVTNKACPGCPLTPDRVLSDQDVREFLEWALHDEDVGHVPECLSVTVAKRKRYSWELPFEAEQMVCCFAFFYCYGRQNIWLREAIEQGIIEYVDITGWESFEESGFLLCTPKWEKGYSQTREQVEWGNQVLAKHGIS